MRELRPLVKLDDLEVVDRLNVPGFIHREHRWMLALMRWAQMTGCLETPCKILTFDFHHDALPPRHRDELLGVRSYDLSIPETINICEKILSENNDDWITAGMEIGIISNAVVFGVEDRFSAEQNESYVDSRGTEHRFFFTSLPRGALAYQGDLSDRSKEGELTDLWTELGWEPNGAGNMRFRDDRRKFALDFDLDCFSIEWRGYNFSWPDEVFDGEFRTASDYHTTKGWTGASWIERLRDSAGMITFALEPRCCGGIDKSNIIWDKLNRYLFSGRLIRRPLSL